MVSHRALNREWISHSLYTRRTLIKINIKMLAHCNPSAAESASDFCQAARCATERCANVTQKLNPNQT